MKTKLTLMYLMLSTLLTAQVTNLPTIFSVNEGVDAFNMFGIVPTSLAYDGTNRVYIRTAEDKVAIYANDFTPVKQFNISATYNVWQRRSASHEVTVTITYGNVSINNTYTGSVQQISYYDETIQDYVYTYEVPSGWTNMDIAQYLSQYGTNVSRIENIENGTLFFFDYDLYEPDGAYNEYYYFLPAIYGKQYPKRGELLQNGFLYEYIINYDVEKTDSYTYGEWVEKEDIETHESVQNNGLGFVNYDNDQLMFSEENGDGLCLTQTLFNEDAQYEYLHFPISGYKASEYYSPNAPTPECNESSCTYTEDATRYYYTYYESFEIKSETGATLQSVSFPNGFQMIETISAEIIKLSDEYYILCTGYMNNNATMLVYKINRSNSGAAVQQVCAPINIGAYPNPAKTDQIITIQLTGENAGKAQTELQITDMQGKTIGRRMIPAGQQQTTVPAKHFAPGMNIINILQNGKSVGTEKVIVK